MDSHNFINNTPQLYLAPMEGVVDWIFRDHITALHGIDFCVTEFIRITDKLYPDEVFYKYNPELKMGSKTRHGTPVFTQLLGGQAQALAENAKRATELGAIGIDLNFGCPAKTVNRHDGGASLLKYPHRIYDIVKAVRQSVPNEIPVSAKIRLGFDNPQDCLQNVKSIEEAGASWVTIHCRTKTDGYKPPAFWEWIPKIKETSKIKIIANGEIWNVNDFHKCQKITGVNDFMIGRGALCDPYIFSNIKKEFEKPPEANDFENQSIISQSNWSDVKKLIPSFFELAQTERHNNFAIARTKQWLKSLSLKFPEAKELFERVKTLHDGVLFYNEINR